MLLALGICAAVQAAVPTVTIDDVIDREMPASGVPGLAYAVVADGAITTVGARGVVKKGSDEAVTPDTPFLVGSVTKSFTALAVMQLAEADEIDLDAPISRYLDVFTGRPAGPVTIRQLLSHTSGFSTLQGSHVQSARGQRPDTLARVVAGLAEVAPAHAPGSRWEYSNVNYQILGRLIEVVSGQDYQAYVTTHILEPVGMTHSFVADGEVHPEMATGHRPWFGTKRPLGLIRTDRRTAPQGGIIASARDLARYLGVMMNGEDDVLSAAGKAAMMRPASDASPFYGFGWAVDPESGSVWHSGASPGFGSLASMVPAQRKGAVVLVNATGGLGFGETEQLLAGAAAAALGQEYAGEGSRWSQKALFAALALTPFLFLLSIAWAWRHREGIRAKSGAFGLFSLWFPLLPTLAMAWIFFIMVPRWFGISIASIRLFLPDLGLALIASAATGVAWAVFRLGVAYSGRFRALR